MPGSSATASLPPPPVSSFTSSLGNILSSSFTDQSTGTPTTWNWDFGDGTTSNQQNPTKVYTTEGRFPVSLTASNAGGSHISTGVRVVINRDGPDSWWRPKTSFGWTELGLNVPNLLFLCQDVTGSIVPTIDGVGSGQWAPSTTGNLYLQTVSGWNAGHIGLLGDVINQNWSLPAASTSLNIPLSSSHAMVVYSALGTPSSTQRWLVSNGNANYMDIGTGGTVRARHDSNTGTAGVQTYNNIDLVHQMAWYRRSDIDDSGGRTNLEPLFGTHTESAYAGEVALGSNTTTLTAPQRTNLIAIFTGSNAEFDMGATFAALRGVPRIPRYKAMGTFVATATTMTASWPTHKANDVALLVVETEGAASLVFGSQADFVQVTNSPQSAGDATTGTKLHVYWCRASGSAQESVTFEDSGNHQCARIITFEGCVTNGNPWDVTAGDTDAVGSTTVTMPGVTTTVDHTLVVNIATSAADSASGQFSGGTNADLMGLRLFFNNSTSSGNGGGMGLWVGEFRGSGSVDATTATAAASTQQGRMTIALRGQPPTDGPDDWFVPSSTSELADLGISAHHLWLCQETASLDLSDSIDGATLLRNGTVDYQQPIPGWRRKAVMLTETTNERMHAPSGSALIDATSTSVAWMGYIHLTASGSLRNVINLNGRTSPNTLILYLLGGFGADHGKLRMDTFSGSVKSTQTYDDGLVHPFLVRYDRTAQTYVTFTDKEVISGSFSYVYTEGTKGIGATNSASAASASFLWLAAATGSVAESWDKTTLEKLGVTLPY